MSKLDGSFETGAHDAETNDFILTTVNTYSMHEFMVKGFDAERLYDIGLMHVRHIPKSKIDFQAAQEYFTARVKELKE